MKKIALGLFSLTLLATACKKSKDAPAITKENLIGSYKMISFIATPTGGGQTIDMMAQMDECQKDDITTLSAADHYNVVDAGVVCDPSDNWEGTWNLTTSGEDKILVFDDQNQGKITKFDGSIVEVTEEDVDLHLTYKTTMKKQ